MVQIFAGRNLRVGFNFASFFAKIAFREDLISRKWRLRKFCEGLISRKISWGTYVPNTRISWFIFANFRVKYIPRGIISRIFQWKIFHGDLISRNLKKFAKFSTRKTCLSNILSFTNNILQTRVFYMFGVIYSIKKIDFPWFSLITH